MKNINLLDKIPSFKKIEPKPSEKLTQNIEPEETPKIQTPVVEVLKAINQLEQEKQSEQEKTEKIIEQIPEEKAEKPLPIIKVIEKTDKDTEIEPEKPKQPAKKTQTNEIEEEISISEFQGSRFTNFFVFLLVLAAICGIGWFIYQNYDNQNIQTQEPKQTLQKIEEKPVEKHVALEDTSKQIDTLATTLETQKEIPIPEPKMVVKTEQEKSHKIGKLPINPAVLDNLIFSNGKLLEKKLVGETGFEVKIFIFKAKFLEDSINEFKKAVNPSKLDYQMETKPEIKDKTLGYVVTLTGEF
ncbi:hypothetical protein IT568_09760 [bacterium]|nr:hypothetical protein [bacterium]